MKTIFRNIPGKSLLIFVLSLFGPWYRALSLIKSEQFDPTLLVLNIKNGSILDLAVIPGLEAFRCFLWFISMVLILETISLAFTVIRRRRSDKLERRSHAFFMKYYTEVLVRYSLCYFLFMFGFVVVCFVCNMHMQAGTEKSTLAETISLTKRTDRNLQGVYSASSNINIATGITGELISPSSSSTVAKSVFLVQMDIHTGITQIIISNDSNTAFILTGSSQPEDASLQIFNVTIKDSPSLIVNFSSFVNSSYSGDTFSMVLSSDEKTMVINTASALQILDISDLASPVSRGIISQVNTTYYYFTISPDAQTIFASINFAIAFFDGYNAFQVINISNATSPTVISSYNFPLNLKGNPIFFIISDDYTTVFLNNINIEIINITDLQSPQLISSINNSEPCGMFIYQEYLYLDSVYTSSMLVYNISNISDLENPVSIATLNLSYESDEEDYGSFNKANWDISNQLGFITYVNPYVQNAPGILRIVNISNNTLNTIGTIQFSNAADEDGFFIYSSDGRYTFFSNAIGLYVITLPESIITIPQAPATNGNHMILSSDGKTLFIGSASDTSEIWIVQLNFNIKARQALDLLDNQVGSSTSIGVIYSLAICWKTNKLYIQDDFIPAGLIFIDFTNPASIVYIDSPTIQGSAQFPLSQVAASSDGKYLFGTSQTKWGNMTQFGIYNLSDGQLISSFLYGNPTLSSFSVPFVVTPDSNTVLILQSPENFFILDVSNRTNVQLASNVTNIQINCTYLSDIVAFQLFLSNDGKTAFIIGVNSSLGIYDISLPDTPSLVTIYNDLPGFIMSIAQSLDGNTLFITTTLSTSSDECTLNIIDATSLSSPTFITAINLIDSCLNSPLVVASMISNEETLFLPLNNHLAVIDVTLVKLPTPLNYYRVNGPNVFVSPDYRTLIVSSDFTQVSFITLTPENILYSELNSFRLGQTKSITLSVFTRNPSRTYDFQLIDHKFTDLSLSVPSGTSGGTIIQTHKVLPEWMAFDQNRGVITFSPNSAYQIGVYALSGTLSKQVPNTTFIGVGPINNASDSFNLFYTLVISGYLDNQGYLTSSFDSTQPLLLPQQYINEELIIRQKLAKYSVKASTQVYITESLTLTLPDSPSSSISIDTLSLEPLNVMITLEGKATSQPKFVTTEYSFTASFSQNNTVISMAMSLLDANAALSQLIVFLNGSQSCAANITITDGLNPTLTQIVPDISQYFYINSQPIINVTYFQSQLAKISPSTGEQFVFQIDSSTFSDINNQPLTLSIQMENGSPAPEWLELKDLSLIGTFPEQITGREIDLILTVSNQYQSNVIGFTLDAGISIDYALRLIGTYGGALITIIGLLVYAPLIYNIFAKRYYRYSKEFKIMVGQEINAKVLYPIYFGLEPLCESRLIMRELDKKIAQEVGSNNKAQIAECFTGSNSGSYKIDRAKLIEAIENTAAEIREKDKNKLSLYGSVLTSEKELINQLIINNYIMRLLDLGDAKPTKAAFNLIKRDILSLVNLDKCLQDEVCIFSVNITRLYSVLRKYNIKTSDGVQSKHEEASTFLETSQYQPSENQTEQESLETELLDGGASIQSQLSNANINMLIYFMEAYAFNQHIIDADILKINIMTKQRLVNNWSLAGIRSFFKLDLEPINLFKKECLAYGIQYITQENGLTFYGTASKDIKNKTIVMQIVTRRGKILREIWIHGIDADAEPEKELLNEEVL